MKADSVPKADPAAPDPKSLPADGLFFDVEGLAVYLPGPYEAGWSFWADGRAFPISSAKAFKNGARVSKDEFLRLIEKPY